MDHLQSKVRAQHQVGTPAGFCEDGSPAVDGECDVPNTTPAGFCEDGSPAVEGACPTPGVLHQQDSVKMDHLQSKVNVMYQALHQQDSVKMDHLQSKVRAQHQRWDYTSRFL